MQITINFAYWSGTWIVNFAVVQKKNIDFFFKFIKYSYLFYFNYIYQELVFDNTWRQGSLYFEWLHNHFI